MSREANLAKNTIIISIGNICTKLITFLLLPLYTGILSTEEYGIVELLNTITSLLLPIVTLQLEQAIFRFLIDVREKEKEQKKLISTSFWTVLLQCVVYFLLFLFISAFVKNDYKYFLVINVIAYSLMQLILQIARGLGNNKKYAIGSFISALATILCNILLLVLFDLKVYGMLMGTFLGQVIGIGYLFFSLKLYRYISLKAFSKDETKNMVRYSVPLIPNAISWWIFNASDRVIVSILLGMSSTGILSAASKFSAAYQTIFTVFNISWTEEISIHINDSDITEYFNKIFNILLKFFVTLSLGAIAIMPFIYNVMVNENYSFGYNLVPILLIAAIFNVIIGLISVIYVAKKNTKAIASTSIISALINIFVHLVLIRFVGLYAAAISTFISYLIMSIYRMYDIHKKYFKIIVDYKFAIISFFMGLIILTTYYLNNMSINIIILVITVIYALLYNKSSIKLLISFIKRKGAK